MQKETGLHATITSGFKAEPLPSSSSELPPSLSLDFLVERGTSCGMRSGTPGDDGKVVDQLLSLIRTQYLQARPPQQIKELKNLLEKFAGSQRGVVITATATSTRDQEVGGGAAVELSPIRKECTSTIANASNASKVAEEGMREDLDGLGNKTKKDGKLCRDIVRTTDKSCDNAFNAVEVGGNETSCMQEYSMGKCASSSILISKAPEVLTGLYSVTIGYPPPLLATDEGEQEEQDNESFLHPPIQYRIAFAKYIIKQLELSGNWSAPQGSNEEDEGDPVEQKALLLEQWYDRLESLSTSSARQVLSEPFYRLYEIKVAHHNRKGSSRTSNTTAAANLRNGIVKIFEHETSFVADGTTGLVTWKASTEFLNWLTSPRDDGGELLLETLGEGKELEWILELGCGCGFLAVGMCKCIPGILHQYIATDGSLAALEKAKQNVEANFSESDNDEKLIRDRIRFEKVEWRNEETTRESFTQLVDGMTCIYGADKGLLLGADIVFDPELIPDLVALILDFLEAKAGRAILACTIRNETTLLCLKQQLASNNLLTKVVGKWEDGEILEISLS